MFISIIRLILLMSISTTIFVGCINGEAENTSATELESFVAKSDTCEKPPKVLNWSGQSYELISENTSEEPGMKYGFVNCDEGSFTIGDGGTDTLTIYSVGNPKDNSGIIFIGKWGHAIYSIKSNGH
ncbi:hypothetical protein [Paenibacillus glycanilyticus]|uniref:Lipoprotein n=1 Tax=Paenibacillus glycanilyticus TaxID=126569 RepID=A0ABQ6GGH1_9BACL|nr:hypothetical protein [Paenibacillus glycanilyticus]GLX69323.1 hypothetical protein MU1_36680 [Paenibacillus glycanilyticus]